MFFEGNINIYNRMYKGKRKLLLVPWLAYKNIKEIEKVAFRTAAYS